MMKRLWIYVAVLGLVTANRQVLAQKRDSSPFNTIGTISKCYNQRGNEIREDTDSISDESDESEICEVAPTDMKQFVPLVSLPLKELKVNSPFGIRKDPLNRKKSRMHNGIDLKAHFEDVYSMLPGKVVRVGYSNSGGYYVTVSHGACVCSYLHLSKIKVREGQHVSAGQTIAISGNSGKRTTGAHLHLSCRLDDEKGKFFDPVVLLAFVSESILKESDNK